MPTFSVFLTVLTLPTCSSQPNPMLPHQLFGRPPHHSADQATHATTG